MTQIYGVGNLGYRPVTAFTSSKRVADTQTAEVMPKKEEKKSKHTVLKALTVAAVVAGAVLLIKNRGKIADKIKGLIDSLKPNKPSTPPTAPVSTQAQQVQTEVKGAVQAAEEVPIVERIEKMVGLDKEAKSAEESMGVFIKDDVKKALSQKTVIAAEKIDAEVAAREAGKSAKESASVFENYGLTQYERGFAEGQKASGVAALPANTTGTVSVPQPVRPQGVVPQTPVPQAPEVRVSPEVIEQKPAKTGRRKGFEPTKNEVVREHSVLRPGEKFKPRSKTNSRKIRHNKRQIIEQTLAQEEAELAPVTRTTRKPSPKRTAQVVPLQVKEPEVQEQIMCRMTTPEVKTPQYTYPESVYKYETELAAKKKAADIEAAWKEYEHRKLYGE